MEQQLQGKVALISGGARGMGASHAREIVARGGKVVIGDVLDADGTALADELGDAATFVHLDVTEPEQWETAVSTATTMFGKLDVLVNNAGIQHVSPIDQFDPERFSFMLRLMLEAPFLLIRAALPGMYERGFGRILNVSSVHGIRASAYKSAYVTAKHGLEGLSKTTALEGGPHGVTSVCIDPGYVRSPLVEKQLADQAKAHGIPESEVLEKVLLQDAAIKRLVEPDEVASLALWLAGPDAGMVTGASYTMDGGWSAH